MNKRLLANTIAGLIFLAATVSVCGLLGSYMHAKQHDLYLTPLYSDANGWELYTVADGVRHVLQSEDLLRLTQTPRFISLAR